MINQDTIRLQKKQLQIMDEIHRICINNNINYYIIGGTALGAVRHKGFIPWDVDIDIAMPREDYIKFKEVCNSQLDSIYEYKDYITNKNHTSPHALVCLKNTAVVRIFDKFNKNLENREIYVDIFPLDTPPHTEKERLKHQKQLKALKRMKQFKHAYMFDNNFIKCFVKLALKHSFFWISVFRINKKLDTLMQKYNHLESDYICSMASHYSYKKQCMLKEVYGTPQLIKFEDREYFAPEQIDKYLTIIYKDYMKLPPVSEQEKFIKEIEKVVTDEQADC